jgi:hypothetical protein
MQPDTFVLDAHVAGNLDLFKRDFFLGLRRRRHNPGDNTEQKYHNGGYGWQSFRFHSEARSVLP